MRFLRKVPLLLCSLATIISDTTYTPLFTRRVCVWAVCFTLRCSLVGVFLSDAVFLALLPGKTQVVSASKRCVSVYVTVALVRSLSLCRLGRKVLSNPVVWSIKR
jgi:hypothetical protein